MTRNLPDPPAHVVVLASGGLGSTTLAYHLRGKGAKARLLSFDYGQRHARELECTGQVAGGMGVPHDVYGDQLLGCQPGQQGPGLALVPLGCGDRASPEGCTLGGPHAEAESVSFGLLDPGRGHDP